MRLHHTTFITLPGCQNEATSHTFITLPACQNEATSHNIYYIARLSQSGYIMQHLLYSLSQRSKGQCSPSREESCSWSICASLFTIINTVLLPLPVDGAGVVLATLVALLLPPLAQGGGADASLQSLTNELDI